MIKVDYVDHLGNDLSIVNAARVCVGKHSDQLKPEDEKLIDYLATHQHLTPFEHVTLTVLVECPLAIRSQIHRHRTFSYNEVSRRYTSENIEFYLPPADDIRQQAAKNKQGSDGQILFPDLALNIIRRAYCDAENAYEALLSMGVAREQARFVLPTGLMTKFYMTGNLRNFIHFVKLRIDPHAQKEAQDVGNQLLKILEERFPTATKALMSVQC